MEAVDLEHISKLIEERIKAHGSKAAYARHLGITKQQLGRSLKSGMAPDAKVLADLGMEKRTVYCKKDSDDG